MANSTLSRTISFFEIAHTEKWQDCFLEWLLRNYKSDCKSLRECSRSFIDLLFGKKISRFEIYEQTFRRQYQDRKISNIRIDLYFECLVDGEKYCVLIEDKKGSKVANDLIEYRRFLTTKASNGSRTLACCITSEKMDESDRNKCSNANFILVDDAHFLRLLKKYEEDIPLIKEFLASFNLYYLEGYSGRKKILRDLLSLSLKDTKVDLTDDGRIVLKLEEGIRLSLSLTFSKSEVVFYLSSDVIQKSQIRALFPDRTSKFKGKRVDHFSTTDKFLKQVKDILQQCQKLLHPETAR